MDGSHGSEILRDCVVVKDEDESDVLTLPTIKDELEATDVLRCFAYSVDDLDSSFTFSLRRLHSTLRCKQRETPRHATTGAFYSTIVPDR